MPFILDPSLKLPPLGIDGDSITISGFSGGSFASTNMHVIYSETFKGVGLLSGGPFGIYQSDQNVYNEFYQQGTAINEMHDCHLNMYWQEQAARKNEREKEFVKTAREL